MKEKTAIILLLAPFGLLMAVVAAAVGNVLVQSVGYIPAFGLTKPTLSYYVQVFTRPDFLSAVWVSLRIALFSSVLSCLLGVLVSMALIRCGKTRGGLLYAILKGWNAEDCLHFGWATGVLATTMLNDYAQPADEEQVWAVWSGNARVKR